MPGPIDGSARPTISDPGGSDDRASADSGEISHRRPRGSAPTGMTSGPSPTPPPSLPLRSVRSIDNRTEVARALEDSYPPVLRDQGIGGTVNVWFLIDETGAVHTDHGGRDFGIRSPRRRCPGGRQRHRVHAGHEPRQSRTGLDLACPSPSPRGREGPALWPGFRATGSSPRPPRQRTPPGREERRRQART